MTAAGRQSSSRAALAMNRLSSAETRPGSPTPRKMKPRQLPQFAERAFQLVARHGLNSQAISQPKKVG